MTYVSTNTFISLCYEHEFNIPDIQASLKTLGLADTRPNRILHRINNLRRKGALPLESGNKVESATILKGTSTLFASDGSIKQQWVKTDVPKQQLLEDFESAIESIIANVTPVPSVPIPSGPTMDELLTVYPIGDAHIGMLAHGPEAGADHDLIKAESDLTQAMTMLVNQANPTKEAYIVDLGDLLHSDNYENRTAASGHSLDVDGRYHKVLEVALRTIIKLIDLALTKHETVYWRSVSGNHNVHSAVMMNLFVQAYYRDEPRVIIRNSPAAIDYFQFGKVLLATTHGHTMKADRIAQIIPVDCSDIWSSTKFRYALTGHAAA